MKSILLVTISPVFTTNDQHKQQKVALSDPKFDVNDNTVEISERHKTSAPEKPPRSKPEAQRTRNTVENETKEETSDKTTSSNIPNTSELSVLSVIDVLKKSESPRASQINHINDNNKAGLEKSIEAFSSSSSISSRDNTLPVKSLPGPPVPDRPLRPSLSSLSCSSDLATVGEKKDEFQRGNSHRGVGYRMAKSSSRIFSACISGQKDTEEGTTMKLRRSTSEGKVAKDKRNESRTSKSRSVHFDGNDEGKIYVTKKNRVYKR